LGPRIKNYLALAIFGISTVSIAESLSFSSFQIELEDGWVHSLERGPQMHNGAGELINIYHPDGNGILKIQAHSAPHFVSKDNLRNMTNVNSSTPLSWQSWGDYSGYQYDYSERGSFYRQWWLVNDKAIIFITYRTDAELENIETDAINRIINSIASAKLQLETNCVDPRPEQCTMDYRPVCALRDTGVRCVTTPCPATEWKTYSNSCAACSDPGVIGYKQYACPEGDSAS